MYTLRIEHDDYPENPFDDWDMLGTLAHWHSRYSFCENAMRISSKEELEFLEDTIYVPVYMYDHSGITINTTGFSCPWDSGQVGVYFVSKEKIRKEYGVKKITKSVRKKVLQVLTGEIETFDQYLRGDVYFYVIEKDGVVVGSCGGFYGEDYAIEEGKSTLEWFVKDDLKTHAEKVKNWIRNKVPLMYREEFKVEVEIAS